MVWKPRTLTDSTDDIRAKYVEIIATQSLADTVVTPSEIADIYLLAARLGLDSEYRQPIVGILFCGDSKGTIALAKAIPPDSLGEDMDAFFFSVVKDLVQLSKVDMNYGAEEREIIEEVASIQFSGNVSSIMEIAERIADADEALLLGRLSLNEVREVAAQVAIMTEEAGLPLPALVFSGSVIGLCSADTASCMTAHNVQGVRGFWTKMTGLRMIAQIGISTHVSERWVRSDNTQDYGDHHLGLILDHLSFRKNAIALLKEDVEKRPPADSGQLKNSIALLQRQEQKLVTGLIKALNIEDRHIVKTAGKKIILAGEPAVAQVIGLLGNRNPDIAGAAIEILSRIGEPSFGLLFEALRSDVPGTQNHAFDAFVKMGEPGASFLVNKYMDSEPGTQELIRRALFELRTSSTKPLVKLLQSERADERAFAAETLGHLSDFLVESILFDYFHEQIPKLIMDSIKELGPLLINYVVDKMMATSKVSGDRDERQEIKKQNVEIRTRKKEAEKNLKVLTDDVVDLLEEPMNDVSRRTMDRMFEYFSRVARPAGTSLRRALENEDTEIAAIAEIEALVSFRSGKAKSVFVRLTKKEGTDQSIRIAAAEALGSLCYTADKKDILALEEVAAGPDLELASAAKKVIDEIQSK